MSTGALSPAKAALEVREDATSHLSEPLHITFTNGVYGGMLLAIGGVLSDIASTGSSGLGESNPALPRLLSGVTFPLGLVIIYFGGAELYTGYPMWYTITWLSKRGKIGQYIRGPSVCWLGNLLGTLLVAGLFSVAAGTLTEEPYRSGILSGVKDKFVEPSWLIVFLRAAACGWLVTFAMYLGTQHGDGVSKALALHIPFFISCTAHFPHTVESMYSGLMGLLLQRVGGDDQVGAATAVVDMHFDFGTFIGKCLLPVTLGNTLGGAVGTGAYIWWVHIREHDIQQKNQQEADGAGGRDPSAAGYSDEG